MINTSNFIFNRFCNIMVVIVSLNITKHLIYFLSLHYNMKNYNVGLNDLFSHVTYFKNTHGNRSYKKVKGINKFPR